MRKLLFMVVGVVVLFSVSSVFADTLFVANLTGDQETPAVDTAGGGLAVASLNEDETVLTVIVSAFNLNTDITASHIHMGPAGVAGGVIFGIGADYSSLPVVKVWDNITAEQVAALKNEGLYVNVHSMSSPGGEIRGQLLPLDQ